MTKKHVSLLVVFVLLFTTLFSSFAFAADEEDWETAEDITIKASYHVQTYGDKTAEGKGALTFGTNGESKRLENFGLELAGAPADMEIRYGVHAQTYGDLPKDGLAVGPAVAGTKGEAKRLEGVKIGLYKKGTDELYPGYQISYQVHMQGYGWGADADNNAYKGNEDAYKTNGEFAGTKGLARRIEAVSLVVERIAELRVSDVSASNLKQVEVEFNQEVVGNKNVENKENYNLENSKGKDITNIEKVDVDGNVAVLTFDKAVENQTKANLVIDKAVLGEELTEEVVFKDLTEPTAEEAEVIGKNTIKVTFSEPVNADTVASKAFTVKSADGKTSYSIKNVTLQKNNTEALIEVRKDLKDGDELVLTIDNSIKDYANLRVASAEFELVVEEDDRAIEVEGYKNASEDGVTLLFNKNIKVNDDDENNFYHTRSKYTVDKDGVKADGNELVLNFTDNVLPKGTAYIYVDGDALVDYWGNTNEKTIVYEVVVSEDTEETTIKEVKFEAPSTVTVVFNKRLEEKSAEDEDNYSIATESDNKEVKDPEIYRAELGSDEKTVTLKLSGKTLEAGKYLLQVDGVKDSRGNKLVDEKDFTVKGDAIGEDKITADLYGDANEWTIVVNFGRKMDVAGERYSIDNLDNYSFYIDGKLTSLTDISDSSNYNVDFEVSDDEKSAEIIIEPRNAKGKDDLGTPAWVVISRVKDAVGNLSTWASEKVEVKRPVETVVSVSSVEAKSLTKVEVKLNKALDRFEENDFVLTTSPGAVNVNIEDIELSEDGKTVTITLDDDKGLTYDAKYGADPVKLAQNASAKSKSKYGEELVISDKLVADKIAPEYDKGYDTAGFKGGWRVTTTTAKAIQAVELKFTESLNAIATTDQDLVKGAFKINDLKRDDYTLSVEGDNFDILKITFTAPITDKDKVEIKLGTENEGFTDLKDNKVKPFEAKAYK